MFIIIVLGRDGSTVIPLAAAVVSMFYMCSILYLLFFYICWLISGRINELQVVSQ